MNVDGRRAVGAGDGRVAVIDRILAVTGEEAQRVGPDRIRMGEVAARAGVSRASLYRYFANKDELIQAYTMSEFDELFRLIDQAMEPFESFEDRLAAAFRLTIPWLREHPVFTEVRNIAEREIMRMTLQSGDAVAHARDLTLARMNAAVRERRIRIDQFDAAVAGELMTRWVVSLLATPESIVRLDTADDAADFSRRYMMPLIGSLATAPIGDEERSP
jgi:AcrR family transcriptional regulator